MSPSELAQLRRFIASRSARFAEPAILLEITDHFACKVEELLTQDSRLSLDEAMKLAHQSFGIKGFAPLAEAFEQSVYQRYKRWYRAEQRRLLFSTHTLGLIAFGILAGQLFLFRHKTLWLSFNGTDVVFAMELLYAGCLVALRKKGRRDRLFTETAYEASISSFFWLWAGLAIIIPASLLPPAVVAWLTGILAALLGFNLITFARLMNKAREDMVVTQAQLDAAGQ